MLSNREKSKSNKTKIETASSILRSKLGSKTVIKSTKSDPKNMTTKFSKLKPQKKSKIIEFQEKMNSKIHKEYNIKKKEKENQNNPSKSKVVNLVYGERILMNKYKNQPKFIGDLNSTLSPRKEEKILHT